MNDRFFVMASLCMIIWKVGFLYESTLLNPMLIEFYKMDIEKSSFFYTLGSISFLLSTPISFQLRKRKLISRRSILVIGLALMGFSMIIMTGNLTGNLNLWMVYLGSTVNGIGFCLLQTTNFPEIVDTVENRPDYFQYDKESMNLHISGMFVFVQAVAQLIGVFLSGTFADIWGYNTAFVAGGATLITFCLIYIMICGLGEDFGNKPIEYSEIKTSSDTSKDLSEISEGNKHISSA